jgi:hypothetical protein
VDQLTIDIRGDCRMAKLPTPLRQTGDRQHRQQHRTPSTRTTRSRTANDDPNSCTYGLVRRQYQQRKKTHRRQAARRGWGYNHQRVQKAPKIKKIETHTRTHTHTHTHTCTHNISTHQQLIKFYPLVYHAHTHITPQHT